MYNYNIIDFKWSLSSISSGTKMTLFGYHYLKNGLSVVCKVAFLERRETQKAARKTRVSIAMDRSLMPAA